MNIYEKLTIVQNLLKVPKDRYNKFGNYNYRNCEDILEAVKPLLADNGLALAISDELMNVSNRFYIKAVATLYDCESEQILTVSALAREDESKKGMDGSQITGSSSSYARKYALGGLFALNDTKDADDWNDQNGSPKGKQNNDEPVKCIKCGKIIGDATLSNGKEKKTVSGREFAANFGGKCPDCVKSEKGKSVKV